MKRTSEMENRPAEENLPPFAERTVLVESEGIRHLASQDDAGKWRTLSRRRELPEPVQVIRIVW